MNIVRKNFAEKLPEILRRIQRAEFVSLDLEFTGLPHKDCYNMLDTREQRYAKVSKSIEEFFVLQYGVSIFTRDGNKYIVHTYNIFLSPLGSAETQRSSARKFSFLASTVDFLSEHNFDFNTTFSQGVQYLTVPEEKALVQKLEEKKEKVREELKKKAEQKPEEPVKPDLSDLSEGEQALMTEYKKLVRQFCDSGAADFFLPGMNGYLRRQFYTYVKPDFRSECQFQSAKNEAGEQCIKCIKSTMTDDEFQLQNMDAELKNIEEKEGFLRILKTISEAEVPLVFHSAELDLALTLKQFFVDSLPPTLGEFKTLTMEQFPKVFDTLLMARTPPLKNHFLNGHSLGEIYKKCQEQPFTLRDMAIEIPSGFRDYRTFGGQCHEAGYDAFMTGVAFVRMLGLLHQMSKSKTEFSLDLPIVMPFKNRIAGNRFYDIQHVSLDRSDKTPKRENVLYITFPATWRQSDIYSLFGVCGHIKIYWQSDTAAFVCIEDSKAMNLVKSFPASSEYFIQSYRAWRETQKVKSKTKEGKDGDQSDTPSDKEPIEKKRKIENGKDFENDTAKLSLDENASRRKNEVFTHTNTWE